MQQLHRGVVFCFEGTAISLGFSDGIFRAYKNGIRMTEIVGAMIFTALNVAADAAEFVAAITVLVI